MDCWDALLERQVRRPWLSSNYPPLAILSMLPRCRCCQSLSTSRPTSITTFQVVLMLVCCFVKLTKCSRNLELVTLVAETGRWLAGIETCWKHLPPQQYNGLPTQGPLLKADMKPTWAAH